ARRNHGAEEQARCRLRAVVDAERVVVADDGVAEIAGRGGRAVHPLPRHQVAARALERLLERQLRLARLERPPASRLRSLDATAPVRIAGLARAARRRWPARADAALADRAARARIGTARCAVGRLDIRRTRVAHAVAALGDVARSRHRTTDAGELRIGGT